MVFYWIFSDLRVQIGLAINAKFNVFKMRLIKINRYFY